MNKVAFYAMNLKGYTTSIIIEGRNYAAQRLYQHAGFQTKKLVIYYHCWLKIKG